MIMYCIQLTEDQRHLYIALQQVCNISYFFLTAGDGKAPIAPIEEEDDDVPGELYEVQSQHA